jgi:hypothetical protein
MDRDCEAVNHKRVMNENRTPVYSALFQRGPDFVALLVRQLSGANISGSVFEIVTYLNNREEADRRLESGNRYWIEHTLATEKRRLRDEGWAVRTAGPYGSEGRFFVTAF